MMLSMVFVMVMIAEASAERIVEVLDERSDMQNCEHPKYELADGSVEFCAVSYTHLDVYKRQGTAHRGGGAARGVAGRTPRRCCARRALPLSVAGGSPALAIPERDFNATHLGLDSID